MQVNTRTPKQIGQAIRRFRRAAGLTQAELAEKARLWQETVSNIENGSPGAKLETICDLLSALGLEIIIAPKRQYTAEEIAELF